MSYAMLNCDKATYLLTKREFEKLSCTERVKLRMHLMSCKYCRIFAQQSRFISNQLNVIKHMKSDDLSIQLSEKKKQQIQELIDNHQS